MQGTELLTQHLSSIVQTTMLTDRKIFIRNNTKFCRVPYAPEISLYMANEATALWQRTEEELGKVGVPPPFWAFAWAGGQALARHLLDRRSLVQNKRVLDFASGSGLVAIAACKAGASTVEASEIDEFALTAISLNAAANDVAVTIRSGDIVGSDEGWDLIAAGDISYERDMALRVTDWLEALSRRGACVLIGDPGRAYLDRTRLHSIARYRIPVALELEDADVKETSIWQFKPMPFS